MKKHLLLSIAAIALSLGAISCKQEEKEKYSPVEDLERLINTFEQMNETYNFYLKSYNEAKVENELYVYSRDCYLYRLKTITTGSHESGMIYVDGQGVFDYEIKDGVLVPLFCEGPGKVDVVNTFAYGPSGFAHYNLDKLLELDTTKFVKVDNNTFKTHDKQINKLASIFTNEYYLSFEADGSDTSSNYINYSKSKTVFEYNVRGELTINFHPSYKSIVPSAEKGNVSRLYIKNIGTTVNAAVNAYIANPDPLVKKESYGFDENEFEKAFGNTSIPFSNEYSKYLGISEDYANWGISFYDFDYTDNLLSDIDSQMGSLEEWVYNEDESSYLSSQFQFTVKSYVFQATISEEIEEQTIETVVPVYFSYGICPKENQQAEDQILRPKGYFVGSIYRKTTEESISGYEKVSEYMTTIGIDSYYPGLGRFRNMNMTLTDYSENASLRDSFEQQGLYLYTYIELVILDLNSSNIDSAISYIKNDISGTGYYTSVSVDAARGLSVVPNKAKFVQEAEHVMQILGSPYMNDKTSEIVGYSLIFIATEQI